MALAKSISQVNGVTVVYHRITGIRVTEWNSDKVEIVVRSYTAESYRTEEKTAQDAVAQLEANQAELDTLVADPTPENAERRIELSDAINQSSPNTSRQTYSVAETTYQLPFTNDNLTRTALYDALKSLPDFSTAEDV